MARLQKLLDEINDWSTRPFTKVEPKKNHIPLRECNTESYQRSKSFSLSNKRQPLQVLLWTFESLTHFHLSSQELFYCTTTVKFNVKRENREVIQSMAARKKYQWLDVLSKLLYKEKLYLTLCKLSLFFFNIIFILYSFSNFLFEV